MFKVHLQIALLLFATNVGRAAERKVEVVPAVTHGVTVCSPSEKWEHGQDLVLSVPAITLEEFTATAKDKTAPLRGFSEGLLLRSEKNETARALGEYWMGRSLFLANLYGPALQQFNTLVAQNPTARTVAFQIAAMECLRNIHAKFPVPLLTNEASANLPNYFKAGLVSENNQPALLDMGVELVMRRITEKASADTVESALKLFKNIGGGGYYEDYARAIWAANRKKPEVAMGSLKRLADAKDLPPTLQARKNEIRLLLARAYYQDRKFRDSAHYLETVDKRSNAFVQTLIQQSWVDLARNEHRRVVGTAIAFQSTGLRATFAPEPYMTAAMALNEFCLFPEALRMLSTFKRLYSNSYSWLRKQAHATRLELYPEAIAHLTKQATSVPPQLASEWIHSPIFLTNQRAINGSFQQEKAISGHIKSAEAFEAAEAVRLEALRRKVTIREATEIAKETQRKFNAADFTAKDLAKKSIASVKAVEESIRDATKAATAAEADTKRANEAPAISQKLAEESKVVSKQLIDAKAALSAAESAEAAAKALVLPAKIAENFADEKATLSERMTRLIDLAAKEAERKRQLAFLPLQKWEVKAKKTAADADTLAKKAAEAKLILDTEAREHADAKATALKAREEAKAAASALREALKKAVGGGVSSKTADAEWEKAWDKARTDKIAAEDRLRRAQLNYEADDKRLAASEAAVSRSVLSSQSSAKAAAAARARAVKAAGSNAFDAFEKALQIITEANLAEARAREEAKRAALVAESFAALQASVDAGKRKLVEAETLAREITLSLEELKKNATDTRSAKKIAATTESAAKKAATVATAAATKAATAKQRHAKLDREAVSSAKIAAIAQTTFLKLAESVQPSDKLATETRAEANAAEAESRKLRAIAMAAKERLLKMEPLVQSRTKTVMARSEQSGKLNLLAQHAAKRAAEALANIAVAAQAAKNGADKVAEAKAKVQATELASLNAKKAALDAKEKATQAAEVSKECAKFAAAVIQTGGKAGAVTRPQSAKLEMPSPEMARLTTLLQITEARKAQLAKSLAVWIQTLKHFKEGAPRHRERLMARIEVTFKALSERMLKQLEAVAKNIDLVEAEIWHGAGKDLVWQNANPEYAAAIKDGKFETRSPAADGVYDWGTTTVSQNGKREVWDDEVGNAAANIVDNCSNKEKYATLRKAK